MGSALNCCSFAGAEQPKLQIHHQSAAEPGPIVQVPGVLKDAAGSSPPVPRARTRTSNALATSEEEEEEEEQDEGVMLDITTQLNLRVIATTAIEEMVTGFLQNGDAHTALLVACREGNLKLTDLCISTIKAADMRIEKVQDDENSTAAFFAVVGGSLDVLKAVLEEASSAFNAQYFDTQVFLRGMTLMMMALRFGHCDICKFLLDEFADPKGTKCELRLLGKFVAKVLSKRHDNKHEGGLGLPLEVWFAFLPELTLSTQVERKPPVRIKRNRFCEDNYELLPEEFEMHRTLRLRARAFLHERIAAKPRLKHRNAVVQGHDGWPTAEQVQCLLEELQPPGRAECNDDGGEMWYNRPNEKDELRKRTLKPSFAGTTIAEHGDEVVDAFIGWSEEVIRRRGEYIFRKGEPVTALHVLLDGDVVILDEIGSNMDDPHGITGAQAKFTKTAQQTLMGQTALLLDEYGVLIGQQIVSVVVSSQDAKLLVIKESWLLHHSVLPACSSMRRCIGDRYLPKLLRKFPCFAHDFSEKELEMFSHHMKHRVFKQESDKTLVVSRRRETKLVFVVEGALKVTFPERKITLEPLYIVVGNAKGDRKVRKGATSEDVACFGLGSIAFGASQDGTANIESKRVVAWELDEVACLQRGFDLPRFLTRGIVSLALRSSIFFSKLPREHAQFSKLVDSLKCDDFVYDSEFLVQSAEERSFVIIIEGGVELYTDRKVFEGHFTARLHGNLTLYQFECIGEFDMIKGGRYLADPFATRKNMVCRVDTTSCRILRVRMKEIENTFGDIRPYFLATVGLTLEDAARTFTEKEAEQNSRPLSAYHRAFQQLDEVIEVTANAPSKQQRPDNALLSTPDHSRTERLDNALLSTPDHSRSSQFFRSTSASPATRAHRSSRLDLPATASVQRTRSAHSHSTPRIRASTSKLTPRSSRVDDPATTTSNGSRTSVFSWILDGKEGEELAVDSSPPGPVASMLKQCRASRSYGSIRERPPSPTPFRQRIFRP